MGDVLRSPRLWFAAFYLALIPIFATIYDNLPGGSFYDSNIQRENGVANDTEALQKELAADITAHVRATTWTSESAQLQFDKATIRVGSIKYLGNGSFALVIEGTLSGSLMNARISGDFGESVSVDVTGRSSGLLYTQEPGKPELVYMFVAPYGTSHSAPGEFQPPMAELFPQPADEITTNPTTIGPLITSVAIYQALIRLDDAYQGDPASASGSWLRFAYPECHDGDHLGLRRRYADH